MNSQFQEGASPGEAFASRMCARSIRALVWLVMAIMAAGFLGREAKAGFSSMYVFGDSISAVTGGGTQYPPPPGTSVDNYWNGRFSNGRVWVEYLADLQGMRFSTNNDYASFGGGSPAIYRMLFFGNYYPPPDLATSLCVYWPACSDCFALAILGGTNSWSPYFQEMITNITGSIDLLYSQGMRSVMIPNSVDISLVPFFSYTLDALGIGSVAPYGVPSLPTLRTNVTLYNAVLATAISQMRAKYPDLKIYAPDFYTQLNFGVSHPEVYGLTKIGIDALEDTALTDKSFDGPGANYVFWDYLHPTTKVHAFMAAFAAQALAGPMFQQISLKGGNLRLDLANLPTGRIGTLETKTDLATQTDWTPFTSIVVTNSTQTVVISTTGLGDRCFLRLNFPP